MWENNYSSVVKSCIFFYHISFVKPGAAGLLTRTEYFRVGSSTWLSPTSFVSTRIGVELVDGLGN